MIKITEKLTSKVPGITSVFVEFDYDPQIVEVIKTIPCFNFTKKDHKWEIPITYLSRLIDKLCVFDDIDLKLCNITFDEDEHFELLQYKTKPFPYQEEGIQFGLNHDKWLLLDPPGLGKTLQIMYIAEERKHRENIEHCLIVCGINTLKNNWKKEIERHSNLDCMILGEKVNSKGKVSYGSVTDRVEQLKNPIKEFFVITNIETLRDDKVIKAIKKGKNKFDMIVVDEIHTCKSSTSQQGKNLLKLDNFKYKIGATGTLLLNNPLDAYVPLKFIDADRSTAGNYEKYYCAYGGQFGHDFLGFRNTNTLKKQLELFSLRRQKSLLNLPPKNIITEYVDMSDAQQDFYENVKNGVKEEVDKVQLKPAIVMAMIMRLRQATACPSILTSKNIPSAKIDRVCDLCEQITSQGNKVVIFSTFKETVYNLLPKLEKYNPLNATGDSTDAEISENIDKFQNDDEHKVFIGTWQKCGTGITLTKASYMIFLDTPWTDGAFQQACDRIYRIGTKDPVFIYVLVTRNTVDEHVLEIVEDKAAIADFIIDDQITQKSLNSLQKYITDLR